MTTAQQITLRILIILISPILGLLVSLAVVWVAVFEPDLFDDEPEDIEQ